ncbi:hypothetical protein [Brevundimonas sp. DC300-4]|uniref:hypothetical protein n=1 Tax=unclassified Brevundimonas TaxID=2622653 RepID=UPI003CEAF877
MRSALSLGSIFGAPLALAGLSLIGLVGALLADGVWDGLGAALLATTVLTIAWTRLRQRRRRTARPT